MAIVDSTVTAPIKYFDFTIDLMNQLHDVQALLDLACKSEEPEMANALSRVVWMARERVDGVIDSLDRSAYAYQRNNDIA